MALNNNWETVIGMEVHAQVISKSKLFSRASTLFGQNPNESVSFRDAGFPGMLPVLNQFCVDQAIKTGLGINGTINLVSYFDRKNYFYPDLPQGYQISQFFTPIVENGELFIEAENVPLKKIRIERIHLEQDAGKNVHDKSPEYSLIDLNRSGIALMEIVTKPDISSAEEAALFLTKLRMILRYLKTCDGNMEEGSMRADINISVHKPGTPLGTRVEVKNVNSIRFISQAIEYEVARQIEVLENGGQIIQETRLFNSSTGETKTLRTKEDAQDYRYFKDPDLPALKVTKERVDLIKSSMPELPDAKKKRFINEFQLSSYDSEILVSEPEIADYFETVVRYVSESEKKPVSHNVIKIISNWIMCELFAKLNEEKLQIQNSKIPSQNLASLILAISNETISGKIAKEVFQIMWDTGKNANTIIEENGLVQITDNSVIENIINDVLTENEDKVMEYKSGKVKLFGFFVGLIMKKSSGKINPKMLNEILQKMLNS